MADQQSFKYAQTTVENEVWKINKSLDINSPVYEAIQKLAQIHYFEKSAFRLAICALQGDIERLKHDNLEQSSIIAIERQSKRQVLKYWMDQLDTKDMKISELQTEIDRLMRVLESLPQPPTVPNSPVRDASVAEIAPGAPKKNRSPTLVGQTLRAELRANEQLDEERGSKRAKKIVTHALAEYDCPKCKSMQPCEEHFIRLGLYKFKCTECNTAFKGFK